MSDPGKYRTPEELEERKKKDAVLRARTELVDEKNLKEAVEKLEAEVEDVIADAVKFAEESPEPGPELLESTTYAGAFAR